MVFSRGTASVLSLVHRCCLLQYEMQSPAGSHCDLVTRGEGKFKGLKAAQSHSRYYTWLMTRQQGGHGWDCCT